MYHLNIQEWDRLKPVPTSRKRLVALIHFRQSTSARQATSLYKTNKNPLSNYHEVNSASAEFTGGDACHFLEGAHEIEDILEAAFFCGFLYGFPLGKHLLRP